MNSWMNLIKETFISGKGTTISIINDPVGLKFTLYVTPSLQVITWKISDAIFVTVK